MILPDAASPTVAIRLAILLLLVPVTYIAAFVVFSYATLDIRDGQWAILMIDHLTSLDPDMLGLLGARSRLVWSALAVLFVLVMVSAGGFSLVVLARRAGSFKGPVLGGFVILSIAVGVAAWFLGPNQFAGCVADPCGQGCATKSTGSPFLIIPYMGAIFCRIYDGGFVAFFWSFFSVAGPVQMAVNVVFFAAAFSLLVEPRPIEQWTTEELGQRVSDFRVLLVLASAMLTLTGLTELTLWGWLAEIAAGWEQAGKIRDLQVGSALYWGICNSALLLLIFVPLGSLLARQVGAFARRHNEAASSLVLEAWERDQGVALLGRGAWAQVAGILAPLLTGALTFLFQSAVGGG